MKKIARQILVLGLPGAWALIAIGSGPAHSHKCNTEWKIVLNNDFKATSPTEIKSKYKETTVAPKADMLFPGFMHLIFP